MKLAQHPITALSPFTCRYSTAQDYLNRSAEERSRTLATIVHDDLDLPAAPWPKLPSGMRPFEGGPVVEVWQAATAPSYERHDGFQVAVTEDLVFIGIHQPPAPGAGFTLQSEDLYLRLLRLIEDLGFPHLLRIWNIIPGINRDAEGLERYKRFCIGRHNAYMQLRPELAKRYPSASALGPSSGDFCLYLLAAREPGLPVENPNQVSAYDYPAQYGPRSPSFSRALVKQWDRCATLFLSGTASVAGHSTRHLELPVAQTQETVTNIKALIANSEKLSGLSFPLTPDRCFLKAFVRNPDDYEVVRERLEDALGPDTPMLYVESDICRENLLFEIEGLVWGGD